MSFNEQMTRILLVLVILLLVIISILELRIFMPGILGAITLYILSRKSYFQLVYLHKWKKGLTAWIFVLSYLVLLGIPFYLIITLMGPKLQALLEDPSALIASVKGAIQKIQDQTGMVLVTEKSLEGSFDKLINNIPLLLNSTAALITNLVIMLFLLYYLLYQGSELEKTIFRLIPLQDKSTSMLAAETRRMVKANALGIPLISLIQGLTAMLGYYLFGVPEYLLWGLLTGIFAFFPVIGTMVIWVPLVIYIYASGDTWNATWLLVYSVVVTGNVDYIARITIMRRLGNVHPVMTVIGVLIGLGLFGFIGLIFGPLLVSYIIILTKIYRTEFADKAPG